MTLSRKACERRVYRLATLLTGDPIAATRVIEAVVDAQPDLRRLDSARLDRLTVLRCREIEPGRLVHDAVPAAAAEALAGLPAQPREAWVLTNACGLPLRETARSMDCSITATTRHLEHARRALAETLGNAAEDAPAAFRACSASLGVPDFYRRRRARRLQRRRILALVGLLALILALLWLVDAVSPG